tara:strand:- start:41 stop:529 length:489 start_codon:yes stop_codon:yes gene_type:complete
MTKKILSQQELLEIVEYRDGELYWKIKPAKNRHIGDKAGSIRKNGYCAIKINGVYDYAHRFIYLMFYGYMPKVIDHIDRNPSNNKIENLREVTQSQNLCNKSIQSNNKSGIKGVIWDSRRKEWRATCQLNKKSITKYCKSVDEAIKVMRKLREELHGQFAHH